MGHPYFKTQNLNIPTPELQNPEFKITRKAASSYRMPRTARHGRVSTFRLILMSTPLVFG
jgi:hypothetical protein